MSVEIDMNYSFRINTPLKNKKRDSHGIIRMISSSDKPFRISGYRLGLDQNNYILRIRKWENYHVAALKHGTIDHLEHPGLFRGRQWTCYYSTPETVISDLQARAAPEELSEIVKDKKLEVCFSSEYKRLYTTLYMPDRVRIELTLDEGSIHCDGKSESLYHIGFELLQPL